MHTQVFIDLKEKEPALTLVLFFHMIPALDSSSYQIFYINIYYRMIALHLKHKQVDGKARWQTSRLDTPAYLVFCSQSRLGFIT